MEVQRSHLGEDRATVAVVFLEVFLELARGLAEIERQLWHAAIELDVRSQAREELRRDVIEAHHPSISIRVEHLLERVEWGKRMDVLLVHSSRSHPDRRHGEAGPSVAREGIPKDEAVGGKFRDPGSERHAAVV